MVQYDRVAVGKLLQKARKASGYTQESAAEAAGCSHRHIISVEGGTTGLSINLLLTLCNIYHITPNDIFHTYLGKQDNIEDTVIIKAILGNLSAKERKRALVLLSTFSKADF